MPAERLEIRVRLQREPVQSARRPHAARVTAMLVVLAAAMLVALLLGMR